MKEVKDSWVGRTLGGRYKILNVIERGGMGVVYRAQQIAIDREVAVKMLRSDISSDPKWVARFRREAQACSALAHPNTIRLYDYGQTTRGDFYMVMELLKGRSLHALINSEAPISAPRVLRIMMQCCASLSEAHDVGIVHRDVKPENIYIEKLAGNQDFVKLFDFSIAKYSDLSLTAAGTIMGTPEYMSPEQADGIDVDHRSDIYSLGVVAYIMLKAAPLFQGAPLEVLRKHMSVAPAPLPASVPEPVAKLVLSCLAKNPNDRPSSALELLEAAHVWLSEIDSTADLSGDPSLRNTLSSMPFKTGTSQMPTTAPPKTVVKTMLGAVGQAVVFGESFTAPSEVLRKPPRTLLHVAGGPTRDAIESAAVQRRTPPQQLAMAPQQLATPPQQLVTPPQQLATPPQQLVTPPQQLVTPPQLAMAPQQQAAIVTQPAPVRAPDIGAQASPPPARANTNHPTVPPEATPATAIERPAALAPTAKAELLIAEPHHPGESFSAITQRGKSPIFWIFCALLAFGVGFAAFYLATRVG